MKVILECQSGRKIEIDDVREMAVVVDDSLTMGMGKDGCCFFLKIPALDELRYRFNWREFLLRLLKLE